jgi:4-amino-4-deoxy-L-arabinose transferase-like glycosyltransferase
MPYTSKDTGWAWTLPAILGIALLVRLVWAALIPVIPLSDSAEYHRFALHIVNDGIYGWEADRPTAYWPPGTSAAYAVVYWLFGPGQWTIKLFNIATGMLVVFLTFELATRWFDRTVAAVAALLVAIWPVLVEYTTIIGSELLFAAATLGILLLFDRVCRAGTRFGWLAVALGILIGLAALVRAPALLLPFVLTLVFFVQKRALAASLRLFFIVAAFALVVVTPWTVRNYNVFGQVVALSTSGGANLWMGNNPETTGFYQPPPSFDPALNEAEADQIMKNKAVAYIKEAPVAFVVRTVIKAIRLYQGETIGVWWNAEGIEGVFGITTRIVLKVLSQAFWMGAAGLFAIGCYLFARQGLSSFVFHPGIVTMVYFTLIYAIFVIQDRYHIPTNPVMAAFAGYAVVRLAAASGWRFWPFRLIAQP